MRTPNILLVEDNLAEARLIREALREENLGVKLRHARDGEAGLLAAREKPDLVILDLNMPGMNGREVLHRLKTEPETASIPVVVLSVSDREEDIAAAYAGQASAYVRKPFGFDDLGRVMRGITGFYFRTAELGSGPPPVPRA